MLWSGKQGKCRHIPEPSKQISVFAYSEDTFCALRLLWIFAGVSDSYLVKADLDKVFLMNVDPVVILFEKNYEELHNVVKNSLLVEF
jgi:hypothetical protein